MHRGYTIKRAVQNIEFGLREGGLSSAGAISVSFGIVRTIRFG